MTDTIGLSGLSLTDRNYRSFAQDNTPLDVSGPVFRVGGGVYEATLPTYADKDAVPFHFTSAGLLRVDTEIEVSGVTIGNIKVFSTDDTATNVHYGKIDSTGVQYVIGSNGVTNITAGSVIVTQGRDLIGSMYIPAGSVIITNTVAVSGLFSPPIKDNTAYLVNGSNFNINGALYESVPTAISGTFVGALGMTTYRELKIGGYDVATNSIQVTDISPALTQTINVTLLNAVGSNAGSHVSSSVNMDNYREKLFYFNYANPGTGSVMMVFFDGGPDNSTWFNIGSKLYTTAAVTEFNQNEDPHPYVRAYTSGNNGGTLTVTLVGRGA